ASDKGADGASPRPGNEGSETAQTDGGAAASPRTPEDAYADPEYGNVLVGQKELVQAVIKFNYILYVGEMLGKKKD
ncbi:MAG: hypothetical protein J6Y95_07920, partial [Lachnospiraceae bacterium]|nr:hypothetical protein [Lachnospiraceae bacterium]